MKVSSGSVVQRIDCGPGVASSPRHLLPGGGRWVGIGPGARAYCGHRAEANTTFRPLRLGAVTTSGTAGLGRVRMRDQIYIRSQVSAVFLTMATASSAASIQSTGSPPRSVVESERTMTSKLHTSAAIAEA